MSNVAVDEIKPDLFRAEIPLPRNPLKATNSYIIKSERRNLIIDTGMNRPECKEAMLAAIDKLDLKLDNTDFFVTHLHADHIGLVDELSCNNALVYFNKPDSEILQYKDLWQVLCSLAGKHGFPAEQVEQAVDSHPGQRYSPKNPIDFTMVCDGEVIRYGTYELHCVITPGHTRGHTCLYEPNLKYLFSGDHILGDITPNISTWLDDVNPLAQYFKSLDKVDALDIKLVLPGHRRLISDCSARIATLKEHHRLRLAEVMEILRDGKELSAYSVAAKMTWDLVADSWDDYPLMQKWFATGEALAHIRYLEETGEVGRLEDDGKLLFSAL